MTQRILFFFLLSLFLACGDKEEKANTSERTVFRYNQINSITSLDPAFAKSQNNIWAIDHLYNGLVQLDEQLNIKPAIAESWEISADGKVYRFKLREDVYFHDNGAFEEGRGRKVSAKDFVYSFNRIISDEVASPGSWIFKGRVAEIQPFVEIDKNTFELRLITPFRPILGILTMQYCSVVPREAIEKYGKEFRSNPVGTGPFMFKNWLENQSLFLVKNKNYFEKEGDKQLPYLDAVRVNFIGDRKTAYLELMNQKLDFMSGLESSYVDELLTTDGALQPDKKETLQFLKSPFLNTEYLGINLQLGDEKNPLRSKKVRQALNYGFDRNKMLETLRNNVGKAADAGFVPRGLPSFDNSSVKGYAFDPDKARTLLKEAGYPNGDGLSEISLYTNKDYQDLCTFIARQWEDIGVKVNIEVIESATLRQMMTKGQVQMFRGSWIADYPDAESFFTVFYSKNPAPPNYTRFSNPEFDELYETALEENDDQKRYDLYHQMDRILIDEAPVIFLFYDETALFAEKSIKGLSKNAINLLSLKSVIK
ncbi:MAG: oligopeptide transport system substrate-binding protein [Saprospiraceae bacterium]|jgi:oligopeptide transport system substrate-binding protein